MILDSKKILNGTERKKLINGYNELKNDYTRINAIKYSELYENKPLSFVLDNSNYIFTEGYKGYNFYKNIIENCVIPYDQYDIQLGKINEYMSEFGDKMSSTQENMYNELYQIVENVRDMNANAVNLHSEMTKHTSNTAMKVYDSIYLYNNNVITESEMFNEVQSALSSNKCEFMDIVNCLTKEPKLNASLNAYLESCYIEDASEPDDLVTNCKIKNILQRMMRDRLFNETVNHIRNTNLRYNLIGLSQLSDTDLVNSVAYEHVNNYDPMYSTMDDAINRVYVDQYLSEYTKDNYSGEKKKRQESIIAVYETVRDFVLFDMSITDNEKLYTNNDLSYKTYTESFDDNPSIEASLLALNNKLEELKSEYMCEKVGGKNYKGSKFIQDMLPDSAKDENVTRKKKKKTVNVKDDDDEDDAENPYKVKSSKKKNKSSKKKVVTNSDDDDEDDDDNYEETDDNISEDDEDNDNEKSDNSKDDKDKDKDDEKNDKSYLTKKPKGSKIRDIEASITQTNAKVDKVLSKGNDAVKHTTAIVRGATQVPREILKGANDLLQDFELMDENRRKAYMLQPGIRKKWIKTLNGVIQYGTAASISPMAIPLVAFYRSYSNTKNKQLANEMKIELDREIKILDDKIAYAKSIEDNEEAYKMMRTKSSFEYALTRLRTNSKAM